jgi:hypothetical protein
LSTATTERAYHGDVAAENGITQMDAYTAQQHPKARLMKPARHPFALTELRQK